MFLKMDLSLFLTCVVSQNMSLVWASCKYGLLWVDKKSDVCKEAELILSFLLRAVRNTEGW